MQFTWQGVSGVVETNKIGLYLAMTDILRQLLEPMLRQQAMIGKSQTHIERDSLVQWMRKIHLNIRLGKTELELLGHSRVGKRAVLLPNEYGAKTGDIF